MYTIKNLPYLPEHLLAPAPTKKEDFKKAIKSGEIFQSIPISINEDNQLLFNLGVYTGIMPKDEFCYFPVSEIDYNFQSHRKTAFIITGFSSSNRTVSLSRRLAQEKAFSFFKSNTKRGDIFLTSIRSLACFGVFLDIGVGITSMMHVSQICNSRILHSCDILRKHQTLYSILDSIDEQVYMTLKPLLGNWEENAKNFNVASSAIGIVRQSIPDGTFIELTPNLSGLTNTPIDLDYGTYVEVWIYNINPKNRKIKLDVVGVLEQKKEYFSHIKYFPAPNSLDDWEY